MEKNKLSCTVGGNVNWYSHYGEQYGGSLKNKKKELPYDPAIPLLGIYLEKTLIEKDIWTPMLTERVHWTPTFTIEARKQPKCPLTDEWIKNMWDIRTMGYYSAVKSEIMLFAATWT